MKPLAILIGPPGAGKSSIGTELASLLGVSFTDTDKKVEEVAQKSISDIFVESGEDHFRALELQVLESALADTDGVLSLGGGAPLSDQAQNLLRSSGAPIIFLDVSLSAAAPRIGFNRDRPLLLGNPRAKWQELMNTRKPIYESLSTHTLVTDDLNPKQAAKELARILK